MGCDGFLGCDCARPRKRRGDQQISVVASELCDRFYSLRLRSNHTSRHLRVDSRCSARIRVPGVVSELCCDFDGPLQARGFGGSAPNYTSMFLADLSQQVYFGSGLVQLQCADRFRAGFLDHSVSQPTVLHSQSRSPQPRLYSESASLHFRCWLALAVCLTEC